MTRQISKFDDIIDSRDVIARIEELRDERDASDDAAQWDESDEGKELKALEALAKGAEGYAADWQCGETMLIRYSYFRDYAQGLAEDIGAVSADAVWPNNCIDWEQAARELRQDYTAVDFDGVTYWIR